MPLSLALWFAAQAVAGAFPADLAPIGLVEPAVAPGTYALKVEVAGARSAPLLGDLTVRTVTTALVHVSRVGATLVATERACSISSESSMFQGRAPPSLLAGLSPARWELQVEGHAVHARRGPHAVGFEGDVMPINDGDPLLRDPDGNGRPGALMHVDILGLGALDLDVLGVWTTRLAGRRVAPGLVVGRVEAETAERILSGLPFPGELGPLRVDAHASRFTLTRLSDDARTCGDLGRRAR